MATGVRTATALMMCGRNSRVHGLTLALALLALGAAGACDDNPIGPSPPAAPATTTVKVSGRVTDDAGAPVSQAIVTVTYPVTQPTVSDADGQYVVGPFAVAESLLEGQNLVMRVWRDDFVPQQRELRLAREVTADFQLVRRQYEHYTLTISASPACRSLPDAAKIRRYSARVEDSGTQLLVTLSDAGLVALNRAGFSGTKEGTSVVFRISDRLDDDYVLIESIDGVGDLFFSGTARGSVGERGIVAVFDGRIGLTPSVRGEGTSCEAPDHHLEMVR